MSFRSGEIVHGYEILEPAANFGPGEAYQARNVRTRRLHLLKIIPRRAASHEQNARFLREAGVVCLLSHPNIVSLNDAAILDHFFLLALEYVSGVTLCERMGEGPLAQRQALQYVEEILAALDYSHTQGIVHRCVSPQTIVLAGRETARLTGFTCSRLPFLRPIGQRGGSPGPWQYASPEQIKDASDADARADLYSIGAVLYYLLTEKPPFGGEDSLTVLKAHLLSQPAGPIAPATRQQISPALATVVLKSLAKARSQRFQSAAEFRSALRECAGRRETGPRWESCAKTAAVEGGSAASRPAVPPGIDPSLTARKLRSRSQRRS
jgi:eukaryotic-like serine/threonine-protein kinase